MTRAERNIQWCEDYLFIPEGRYVGKKLQMAEFMKDDFRAIYDNPFGTRRAILSRGRKNAKTTECAMIVLLHLCGPEYEPNSSLFSDAQSREQAAVLHSLAAKMVRMSPVLHDTVVIRDGSKELSCPELGTRYRALSAEASTAFGLSPVLSIHDELGQVRGPRSTLYEALETATGAQADPLSIIISTQAATNADLLSILIDDALTKSDPRTVLRFHTADMELDPFAIETIKLANPAFGLFLNEREVMAMAEDARRMPTKENSYRNLVLNQRIEASAPFIALADWKKCSAPPVDLRGRQVYIGLDLSEANDLTAMVMIGNVDGKWHVQPTFWLPEHDLEGRSQRDRVPYDLWHKQGLLQTTPGRSIGYDYVARHLRRVFNEHRVGKLGFDRWNMRHLKPWLKQAGFNDMEVEDKFVEFGQGTQSMSPALRDLEACILNAQLCHGDNPILTMCAINAVIETKVLEGEQQKDSSNRKLSKKRSGGRIDGMVALAMAIGVAPLQVTVDISSLIG